MKEKLHDEKKLTSRLANYAAASGALLALGTVASGQVMWSGPQNLTLTDPLNPLELDIDGDGAVDFLFGVALSSTYWNGWTNFNSVFIRQAQSSMYANSWMGSSVNNVAPLNPGALIGASVGTWNSAGNTWNLGSYYFGTSNSSYNGPFPNQGNKFVGVRFFIGADRYYGWVRINVPALSNQITLVDWAYQTTVGAELEAGDIEGPVATLTPSVLPRTNIQTVLVNVLFDEPAIGLEVTDFTVSNGTAGSLTPITPGLEYTLEVTAGVHGNVQVLLGANSVTDVSLNGNLSMSTNWFYDDKVPTVTLESEFGTITNMLEQTITITFSEAIMNLSLGDFNLTNCTIANLTEVVADKEYTLDVTALGEGEVIVELAADAIVDFGNNPNAASSVSWMVDQTSPSVSFDSGVTGVISAPSVVVEISFDEPVTGLSIDDFMVTNGEASLLTELTPGELYSLEVSNTTDGEVLVELSGADIFDAAGNPLNSNEVSWMYDGTAPVLSLDAGLVNTNVALVTVSITADEEISGLELGDIVVTNGTASNLVEVSAGSEYSIDVTATTEGEVIVELSEAAVSDLAGNENELASTSWMYDITAPGAVITNVSGDYSNNETELVNIVFDEAVDSLSLDDFVITNGSASSFTTITEGLEYSIGVSADNQGEVIVELPASAVIDKAGNTNTEASSKSWIYDGISPTATLSTGLTEPTEEETITIDISFSEEVEGLDIGDFLITNGSASNLTELTAGLAYTLDITAAAPGEVSIELTGGSVIDRAGNSSDAALVEYTYDPPVDALETLSDAMIRLYPNPARDVLVVELEKEATVRIAFLSGKLAIVKEHILNEEIDISALPSGLYLVHIETGDGVAIRKFIKE